MFKQAIIIASLVASGSAFANSTVFSDPYGGYADNSNTIVARKAPATAAAKPAEQKDWFERIGAAAVQ